MSIMKLIINVWSEFFACGELKGADNSPFETTIVVRDLLNELYDIARSREKAKSFVEHVFTRSWLRSAKITRKTIFVDCLCKQSIPIDLGCTYSAI